MPVADNDTQSENNVIKPKPVSVEKTIPSLPVVP